MKSILILSILFLSFAAKAQSKVDSTQSDTTSSEVTMKIKKQDTTAANTNPTPPSAKTKTYFMRIRNTYFYTSKQFPFLKIETMTCDVCPNFL